MRFFKDIKGHKVIDYTGKQVGIITEFNLIDGVDSFTISNSEDNEIHNTHAILKSRDEKGNLEILPISSNNDITLKILNV
ncbi:MAG: hypothetical protein ACOCV8_01275 [Spirochaetota bacterium]